MSYKLVYMCSLCRNRIEYDIESITMYTHEKKSIDGNIECVEKEYHITSPAMVTTISPPRCNHTRALKNCNTYPIEDMIPVPEWVPQLIDEIIKIIPDAYNFILPRFNIWGSDGVESTCALFLSFKTHNIDAFSRFMKIASLLIEKDINGYKSILKVTVNGNKLPPSECSIDIKSPYVNFMSSNNGRGRSFFEYVRHIICKYSDYEQMTIGGV